MPWLSQNLSLRLIHWLSLYNKMDEIRKGYETEKTADSQQNESQTTQVQRSNVYKCVCVGVCVCV